MRFLITAGGSREYIDPVRFISNASSGRMGYALAQAALNKGHKVTLISGPTALQAPAGAKTLHIETTEQMFTAVRRHFSKCDCLIMAAAVADYRPVKKAKTKIKKTAKTLTIKLKPTPDILKWASENKAKNQTVIGFALEDRNLRTGAGRKLKQKNLDMIIANSPAAIGKEKCSVQLKHKTGGWLKIPPTDKAVVAEKIIGFIENLTSQTK